MIKNALWFPKGPARVQVDELFHYQVLHFIHIQVHSPFYRLEIGHGRGRTWLPLLKLKRDRSGGGAWTLIALRQAAFSQNVMRYKGTTLAGLDASAIQWITEMRGTIQNVVRS